MNIKEKEKEKNNKKVKNTCSKKKKRKTVENKTKIMFKKGEKIDLQQK